MESAKTPDEGGHPPDDEVGSHHSPPDDVFKIIDKLLHQVIHVSIPSDFVWIIFFCLRCDQCTKLNM